MRRKKIIKRVIVILVVAAILAGAGFGGYKLATRGSDKEEFVYSVMEHSTTYEWGNTAETYGGVTTDKIQNVYVSSTQKVTEIYVTVGQNVVEGDPIMAYDTTLSDIELQRSAIAIQRLQLQLTKAKAELATIKTYKPYVPVVPTPAPSPSELVGENTPYLVGGGGTQEDPLIYLWNDGDEYTNAFVTEMLQAKQEAAQGGGETPEPSEPVGGEAALAENEWESTDTPTPEATDTPAPSPTDEPSETPPPSEPGNVVYAVFVVRESNALKGAVLDFWGIRFTQGSAGFSFKMTDAVLPPDPDEDPDDGGSSGGGVTGPTYTAAEIAQMKADKEREIRDLDLSIRQAQVEYDRMEQEVSDGVVRSELAGVVKSVTDENTAKAMGQPIVQVSGGGGYYVEGTLSEMELDTIVPGQTVTIMSWESGGQYEGTVIEVSQYPTSTGYSYSQGNTNVSYYPFKVFIDESATLREGEYVSITYAISSNGDNDPNAFYLENMFIRTDGGTSYVYVRNADGLLEKREVVTGKGLWGSYTQIKSGLTTEDYVAFPYGKDVKDGVKTKEGTWQDLYGYY